MDLEAAVARCFNHSEVLRSLGLRPAGGNHKVLQKWIAEWGISTAHFDPDVARQRGLRRRGQPLHEVLVVGSPYSRKTLKSRLYSEGLKERKCEMCGVGEDWHGAHMSLILDHINGVANDNRLENLRIVCPNCAATLPTHCGRNSPATRPDRECPLCHVVFTPKSAGQKYCSRTCGQRSPGRAGPKPEIRRVERPPYEQLIAEVDKYGWSAVGRKYGVSDNAVRKWVRWYQEAAFRAAERDAA
jgi:hypothetical protein